MFPISRSFCLRSSCDWPRAVALFHASRSTPRRRARQVSVQYPAAARHGRPGSSASRLRMPVMGPVDYPRVGGWILGGFACRCWFEAAFGGWQWVPFHAARAVTHPKKSWIASPGMRRMRPGIRVWLPVQLESASEDAPSFGNGSYIALEVACASRPSTSLLSRHVAKDPGVLVFPSPAGPGDSVSSRQCHYPPTSHELQLSRPAVVIHPQFDKCLVCGVVWARRGFRMRTRLVAIMHSQLGSCGRSWIPYGEEATAL